MPNTKQDNYQLIKNFLKHDKTKNLLDENSQGNTEDYERIKKCIMKLSDNGTNKSHLVQKILYLTIFKKMGFKLFINLVKDIGLKYFNNNKLNSVTINFFEKRVRNELSIAQLTCQAIVNSYYLDDDDNNEQEAGMDAEQEEKVESVDYDDYDVLKELLSELPILYLYKYCFYSRNYHLINWMVINEILPAKETNFFMETNEIATDDEKKFNEILNKNLPIIKENCPKMLNTIFCLAIKMGWSTIIGILTKMNSDLIRMPLDEIGNSALHLAVDKIVDILEECSRESCDWTNFNNELDPKDLPYFYSILSLLKSKALTNIKNDNDKTPFNAINMVIDNIRDKYKSYYNEGGDCLKNFLKFFYNLRVIDDFKAEVLTLHQNIPEKEAELITKEILEEIWFLARNKIFNKYNYLFGYEKPSKDLSAFNFYSEVYTDYLSSQEQSDSSQESTSSQEESNDSQEQNTFSQDTQMISQDDSNKNVGNLTTLITNLLSKLEKEKIISSSTFKVLHLLNEITITLSIRNNDFIVCSLFGVKNEEALFYSYIDKEGWIALPGKLETEIFKYILTKLLERARLLEWDSGVCFILRQLLDKLEPNKGYLTKTKSELYDELEIIERNEGYFDVDLSDDSDDEHIPLYQRRNRGEKAVLKKFSEEMMARGQVSKFFTKKGFLKSFEKRKDKSSSPNISNDAIKNAKNEAVNKNKNVLSNLNLQNRAQIVHDNLFPPADVINDLQLLNDLQKRNNLNDQTIKAIGTKFFVAQYRGIHYSTSIWNAEARRKHRKINEIHQPSFSRALYEMSGLNETKNFIQENEDLKILTKNATLLNEQISFLKSMGPICCTTNKNEDDYQYTFDSPLDAIQELYTKNYMLYHKWLKDIFDKKKSGMLIEDPLQAAFLFSQGEKTVTLSTGDTPYHALRYAYGIKFYKQESNEKETESEFESQEHSRLRPRWENNGRVERPYSGKVYTYLFSPLDYNTLLANHLVSMNNDGRVNIQYEIISEREATFWSHIPEQKLVHQHIARYPSFHHSEYSEHFLVKYGLNQGMYDQYKKHIINNRPHTEENHLSKLLLGEHLCAFFEAQLIEDARIAAGEKEGWLIYRDTQGGFSLVPPHLYPKTNQNPQSQEGIAANQQRKWIEENKEKRKKNQASDGWLNNLLTYFKIRASKDINQMLTHILKCSKQELENVLADSNVLTNNIEVAVNKQPSHWDELEAKLKKISNKYKCKFIVKSPVFSELKGEKVLQPAEGSNDKLKIFELAYFGGNAIYELIKKRPSARPPVSLFFTEKPMTKVSAKRSEVSGKEADKSQKKRSRVLG